MYTAFDFDEYWNQFTQSPDPEIFDPVVDVLFPVEDELYVPDSQIVTANDLTLNDLPEQLSLF